jgi:hypothetical protein
MNCCRVVPGTDSCLTEALGQLRLANVETTPCKTVTDPFLPHPFRFTIYSLLAYCQNYGISLLYLTTLPQQHELTGGRFCTWRDLGKQHYKLIHDGRVSNAGPPDYASIADTALSRHRTQNLLARPTQLRRLVAGFLPRRPGFDPRSGHVGFVVDKVALGQVSFSVYSTSVSPANSPSDCSTSIYRSIMYSL